MLSLRKMQLDEFNKYVLMAEHMYATEMLICGEVQTAEQITKIIDEHIYQVLPNGFETPGHHYYTILENDDDIGFIWYGFNNVDAVLYFIYLHPDHRNKGYAQTVLSAYHKHARQQKMKYSLLHVFRHNPSARHIYQKNDYLIAPDAYVSPYTDKETRYRMIKALDQED